MKMPIRKVIRETKGDNNKNMKIHYESDDSSSEDERRGKNKRSKKCTYRQDRSKSKEEKVTKNHNSRKTSTKMKRREDSSSSLEEEDYYWKGKQTNTGLDIEEMYSEQSDSYEISSDEDDPVIKVKKSPPSNEEIISSVKTILKGADLNTATMRSVIEEVYAKYSPFDLSERKGIIRGTVRKVLMKEPKITATPHDSHETSSHENDPAIKVKKLPPSYEKEDKYKKSTQINTDASKQEMINKKNDDEKEKGDRQRALIALMQTMMEKM